MHAIAELLKNAHGVSKLLLGSWWVPTGSTIHIKDTGIHFVHPDLAAATRGPSTGEIRVLGYSRYERRRLDLVSGLEHYGHAIWENHPKVSSVIVPRRTPSSHRIRTGHGSNAVRLREPAELVGRSRRSRRLARRVELRELVGEHSRRIPDSRACPGSFIL